MLRLPTGKVEPNFLMQRYKAHLDQLVTLYP